jgi:hypothetical protein
MDSEFAGVSAIRFEGDAGQGFCLTSDCCAGHRIPLRHRADPMNVDGEGCAFLVRRDEEISDWKQSSRRADKRAR